MKIGILNYGLGNIKSLSRAVSEIGLNFTVINNEKDFINIDQLILPGVGSFPDAMEKLIKKNFKECLINYVEKNKKIIGICLGMQLLATESEEYKLTKGLNFIPGKIKKIKSNFEKDNFLKVPNIGWYSLTPKNKDFNYLKNLEEKKYYFVHSYMYKGDDKYVLYNSSYHDIKIPSIIMNKNIIGLQFHPEKSKFDGLTLLKKIIKI